MIRVYLADDEELLRTALASLLNLDDDITVIAQAPSGDTVLADPARTEADVFLLDLEMPGLGGLDTAKALLSENPQRRIVIVTRHARPGILRSALAAGVRGFVPKYTPAEQLSAIIRRIDQGERHVDADLALDAISVDCPLTERELDALRLTEDGRSVPEIATHLHLAQGTVRNYLSDAITKLGVSTRHAAGKHARAHGWI
ncbi:MULTISPECIES: response regulator transcription factor [Brachybacterium]|uniref:response regulator transcription factor n=1 Tax=Brachybacterium TaxID=43668 RepID=UPI0026491531|nr:response regulator transcription factor [Brachybacterium sp.]MDN5688856.1 response regulator transcription factor [Brachybacterium sp.]